MTVAGAIARGIMRRAQLGEITMSWSHSKSGLPSDVLESLTAVRAMKCVEPEHGFKERALDLVEEVLKSGPSDMPMNLSCYGSQQTNADMSTVQSLSISISRKIT